MYIFEISILLISGLMVGFINTLAGGGSVISLSVLMMLGLPATVANGTNRIAILMQSLGATSGFRQKKVLDTKKGVWLAVPAVIGSAIGAWIAADINEKVFERAVAVILIVMLFFIIYKPERWIKEQKHLIEKKINIWQIIVFFFIGMYGGFIQIGVGYFLLAGIVLSAGYELVKANAIKSLINLLFTPLAILVFSIGDQVNWKYGLVMAVGNLAGALWATRLAVDKGASFVRWVIIVVILLTSAHLFGLIDISGIIQSIRQTT